MACEDFSDGLSLSFQSPSPCPRITRSLDSGGCLHAIKARVRTKFNVSIAESDNHDMWQRAELGICQVGSDRAFVDSALREVVNFIDSLALAPLGDEHLEIINY